jgi:hypothetical protein
MTAVYTDLKSVSICWGNHGDSTLHINTDITKRDLKFLIHDRGTFNMKVYKFGKPTTLEEIRLHLQ